LNIFSENHREKIRMIIVASYFYNFYINSENYVNMRPVACTTLQIEADFTIIIIMLKS
jgi:hypothetical protein